MIGLNYIAGEKAEELLDKFRVQCRQLKAMSHEELKNRIRTHLSGPVSEEVYPYKAFKKNKDFCD
jgi:hypothetical protein